MNSFRSINRLPALHTYSATVRAATRTQQASCHCRRFLTTRGAKLQQQAPAARVNKSAKTNPLDPIGRRSKDETSLAEDKRKFNLLALATVLCMAVTYGIAMSAPLASEQSKSANKSQAQSTPKGALKADSPKSAPESFQGAPVTVIAGGAKIVAHTKAGDDIELVPTGTNAISHFPRTIWLENGTEYTLLGLGVRTVSFLGFEVYVVGLYVSTNSLSTLQSQMVKAVATAPAATALIAGEKDELRRVLASADESYALWDQLLRQTDGGDGLNGKLDFALRIAPTRNTDFHHLRDGWVRGITARSQQESAAASKDSSKNAMEYKDESFGQAMRDFQALFQGKGKAPKGSIMFLTRDGNGKLSILYQGKDETEPQKLGEVGDERIARLIWLGYLGGKNVSSEPARKSIVDGVVELVERPVGTAVARVI